MAAQTRSGGSQSVNHDYGNNKESKIMSKLTPFIWITLVFAVYGGFLSSKKASPFPVLTGPYLGQKPPGMMPEIFAPAIVSVEKYSEFVCMFAPGGENCFFDRHGDDEYQRGAVFETRVKNGKWTKPEIHVLFAKFDDVFLPTLSPDGKYCFFTSYSLPVPPGIKKIIPLYFIKKTKTGWSQPQYLTQSIHASMTLDGTVYLNSGREIKSHPHIKKVIDLHGSLPFDTGHPVISPDGSYLIFDNRKLAQGHDCKLFVIFKMRDNSWTDPVSLEKYINQHAFCAWISYDGKYLFFHSQDNSKGNIFWVSTKIIDAVKPARVR
jgi:Tol biopolymer transport system component